MDKYARVYWKGKLIQGKVLVDDTDTFAILDTTFGPVVFLKEYDDIKIEFYTPEDKGKSQEEINTIIAEEAGEPTFKVWQLNAKRISKLIARPVSMLDAWRLVAKSSDSFYTYALVWQGRHSCYLFGKIGGRVVWTDHRAAAYKLLLEG